MDEYIKSIDFADSNLSKNFATERRTAVNDLLAENYFSIDSLKQGPYDITISVTDDKLRLQVNTAQDNNISFNLVQKGLRRLIKDYFLLNDNYEQVRKLGQPEKIETIDMARRSIHNEGAEKILEIVQDKVSMDFKTARSFFTLITTLYMR